MPVAASAVCMLAYFSASVEQRKNSSTQIVGFLGVVIGTAFHPYWIYFLALIIVFGYFLVNAHPKSGHFCSLKTRPPEQYWTGDFSGEVGRGSGFISS